MMKPEPSGPSVYWKPAFSRPSSISLSASASLGMMRWCMSLTTNLGFDSPILSARSVGGVFSPKRPPTERVGGQRCETGSATRRLLTHHGHAVLDGHDVGRGALKHGDIHTVLGKVNADLGVKGVSTRRTRAWRRRRTS